jgi:hypothetical protein
MPSMSMHKSPISPAAGCSRRMLFTFPAEYEGADELRRHDLVGARPPGVLGAALVGVDQQTGRMVTA